MKFKVYTIAIIIISLCLINGCSNFIDQYAEQSNNFIDTDSPIAELFNTPSDITNDNTINITVGGVDVTAYKYNLDNNGWTNSISTDVPINKTNLDDGIHILQVIGVDNAGNWQSTDNATSISWEVDTNPPQVLFSINNNDEYTRKQKVTLVINSNEMNVLGCCFSNDGVEWSDIIPCIDTIEWNLSPANGIEQKTVYARFYDLAGNVTETQDNIDYIQYIEPVIYFAIDNSNSMIQKMDSLKNSIIPYLSSLLNGNFYIGLCLYNSMYRNNTPYKWILERLTTQKVSEFDTFLNAFPPPFNGSSTPGFAIMSILENNLMDLTNDKYYEIRPKVIILVADGPFDNNNYGHTLNTVIQYASLSCSSGIPVLLHGVDTTYNNDKQQIAQAGQNLQNAEYYTSWDDLFTYLLPKLQDWAEEGDEAKWCCQ